MLWDSVNFALSTYTNGLKWVLPQVFLIKYFKFQYLMGLRNVHVKYTNGL